MTIEVLACPRILISLVVLVAAALGNAPYHGYPFRTSSRYSCPVAHSGLCSHLFKVC